MGTFPNDKDAAREALVELRKRLEGDTRSLGLVETLDRYSGGLRRTNSELRGKVESASRAQESQAERVRIAEKLASDAKKAQQEAEQKLRQRPEPAATVTRPAIDGSHQLVPGVDCPSPSESEYQRRERGLKEEIAHYMPEFVRAVQEHKRRGIDMLVMHQDAFSANLDVDEFTIMGMALKYAGIYGLTVNIIGTNRETLKPKK